MLHVLFCCSLACPCTKHPTSVIGNAHNLKPEIHRNQAAPHFWYPFVNFLGVYMEKYMKITMETYIPRWWFLTYFLMFTTIPGETIEFDDLRHIFSLGWFKSPPKTIPPNPPVAAANSPKVAALIQVPNFVPGEADITSTQLYTYQSIKIPRLINGKPKKDIYIYTLEVQRLTSLKLTVI